MRREDANQPQAAMPTPVATIKADTSCHAFTPTAATAAT